MFSIFHDLAQVHPISDHQVKTDPDLKADMATFQVWRCGFCRGLDPAGWWLMMVDDG